MLPAEHRAEPAFQFDSRDDRLEHRAPADLPAFGERQHRGYHWHRRVTVHRHMRVVEIERVRCGAVHERGCQTRGALATPDQSGLRRSFTGGDFAHQNFGKRFARARDRSAETIEQAVTRDLARLPRHVAPSHSPDCADQAQSYLLVGLYLFVRIF